MIVEYTSRHNTVAKMQAIGGVIILKDCFDFHFVFVNFERPVSQAYIQQTCFNRTFFLNC